MTPIDYSPRAWRVKRKTINFARWSLHALAVLFIALALLILQALMNRDARADERAAIAEAALVDCLNGRYVAGYLIDGRKRIYTACPHAEEIPIDLDTERSPGLNHEVAP